MRESNVNNDFEGVQRSRHGRSQPAKPTTILKVSKGHSTGGANQSQEGTAYLAYSWICFCDGGAIGADASMEGGMLSKS